MFFVLVVWSGVDFFIVVGVWVVWGVLVKFKKLLICLNGLVVNDFSLVYFVGLL